MKPTTTLTNVKYLLVANGKCRGYDDYQKFLLDLWQEKTEYQTKKEISHEAIRNQQGN